MTERCSHCHEEHETQGGDLYGMPFKTCPNLEDTSIVAVNKVTGEVVEMINVGYGILESDLIE